MTAHLHLVLRYPIVPIPVPLLAIGAIKSKRPALYFYGLAGLWMILVIWLLVDPGLDRKPTWITCVIAGAVVAVVIGVYAALPGVLVRKGDEPWRIVVLTAAQSVVAFDCLMLVASAFNSGYTP